VLQEPVRSIRMIDLTVHTKGTFNHTLKQSNKTDYEPLDREREDGSDGLKRKKRTKGDRSGSDEPDRFATFIKGPGAGLFS
jgi:hypothetical protein